MRNTNRFFSLLFPRIAAKLESRIRPRRLILGLTLLASLAELGLP